MSRADYRGGLAPIRTAQELSRLLPRPMYLVISGYAGPIYPLTDRSNPSPAVGIVALKTVPEPLRPLLTFLPIWIHWTQWQSVVVPLLGDPRVTDWRGVLKDLGDLLELPVNVYNPQGDVEYPEGTVVGRSQFSTRIPGGLYAAQAGELVTEYGKLIAIQAESQGY